MSDIPTYTFLPWTRLGVANSIAQEDGDPAVTLRASIPIDLTLELDNVGGGTQNKTLHKDVQLYGPGDIVGIDVNAIVKSEPANWITNFEPNLVPYVEFSDEDFPWRYTPARPGGTNEAQLRPWIALVVLSEDEFDDIKNMHHRPLPGFRLATGKAAADLFPTPAELWAWAHVHVNHKLDIAEPAAALAATLGQDPDLASSRILCPRRLAASTTYHAFLIPTFETGRLAGNGAEVVASTIATQSAWDAGQTEFPYYHRWRFRTGKLGDFEYLVRLLVPQACDKRVGVRDIDVMHPGSNLPPISEPEPLGGKLKLGGALRVPVRTLPKVDRDEVEKYDQWDENPFPHPFEQAMATRINLADDYTNGDVATANADGSADPIVTSPLYGRWHALTERLEATTRNWVHELNLDPRFRVAAGLGTKVVQTNQEKLVDAAWQQAGDVIAANRALRLAQVARITGDRLHQRHLLPLDVDRRLAITAPVHRRVITDGITVRHRIESSKLPTAAIATGLRRTMRPRGRFVRRIKRTMPQATTKLCVALDQGTLVMTREWKVGNALTPQSTEAGMPRLPAAEAKLAKQFFTQRTPARVDALPTLSELHVSTRQPMSSKHGTADSPDAARLKTALKNAYALSTPSAPQSAPSAGVSTLASKIVTALDPKVTVPRRYNAAYRIPSWIAGMQAEPFTPCLVYPEIDAPMYKALSDMSAELFLPNINLIPQNSVTLLETNQKFIESYMVGLNHEMGRELLWREYPTDQRGSYFRQFWDVTSVYPGNPPPDDVREKLRDIPPIHKWTPSSTLEDHNQRSTSDEAMLVLVIRGELLKRYPNAVIYAMKAEWAKTSNGALDANSERELVTLTAAEEDDPPKTKVRTPLFEARVSPDISFIGFDLTATQALGAAKGVAPTDDNAGWFFVIQERPGEPRFGLDQPPPAGETGPKLVNWNSLHWDQTGTPVGGCVKLDKTVNLQPQLWGGPNAADKDNAPMQAPDQDPQAHWRPDTTAAELAYILYQVPVMVAVHAWRMLPS